VTFRRLVLFATDPLVAPISLAFCLSGVVDADSYPAGTPPFVKRAFGAAAGSIPPVRTCGSTGAFDRDGLTVGAGRMTVSLIAPAVPACPWTSSAHGVSRSTSSGSEQIPLLVETLGGSQTRLRQTAVRTSRSQLAGKSLDPNLSLERSAA
jgi:hypothetical protein